MNYLIDDVARLLAGPTPRRKALRLIGGSVSAALLGMLGVRPARAQTDAKRGCDPSCPPGACCGQGSKAFCAGVGRFCCGSTSCLNNQVCCKNKTCCAPGYICHPNGTCSASRH